jgi:hypothetical protein
MTTKIGDNVPVGKESVLTETSPSQAQATAGAELHSWLSSALETRRTHLRNVLEGQWINPLLKRLMLNKIISRYLILKLQTLRLNILVIGKQEATKK